MCSLSIVEEVHEDLALLLNGDGSCTHQPDVLVYLIPIIVVHVHNLDVFLLEDTVLEPTLRADYRRHANSINFVVNGPSTSPVISMDRLLDMLQLLHGAQFNMLNLILASDGLYLQRSSAIVQVLGLLGDLLVPPRADTVLPLDQPLQLFLGLSWGELCRVCAGIPTLASAEIRNPR